MCPAILGGFPIFGNFSKFWKTFQFSYKMRFLIISCQQKWITHTCNNRSTFFKPVLLFLRLGKSFKTRNSKYWKAFQFINYNAVSHNIVPAEIKNRSRWILLLRTIIEVQKDCFLVRKNGFFYLVTMVRSQLIMPPKCCAKVLNTIHKSHLPKSELISR